MGLFLSPYILQTAIQALLAGMPQTWVHIDDILLWSKSEQELKNKVEQVIRLLHSARFRINVQKSVLQPRSTVHYCGLVFTAGKDWNFTADKLATLSEVLRTWDSQKKKRTQRYLGFLAYILSASGLSSAWAKLMERRKAWRYLFKLLFSRLPRAWKDRRPRSNNWACDAASGDLAVTDNKAKLRWYGWHNEHINVAEAIALIKAITIMPMGTAVWTDSKVAMGWSKRARRGWPISAVLSWLLVVKDVQVFWLPSAWNPADKFTRRRPTLPRNIGGRRRGSQCETTSPHLCILQALRCGGFYGAESTVKP